MSVIQVFQSVNTFLGFFSKLANNTDYSSRGQFAVVKKCVEKSTGAEYAAKIIRKKRVARGVAAADIAREAGLLARLKHPNIVSLYKVIDTGNTVVLLLELISGGELFHWIPSNEAEAAHVVSKPW